MMMIIIRCALLHGEIVRNKFMIPEGIIELGIQFPHTLSLLM